VHTSQTFLRRPFKKQYSVGTHPVLGSAISPSHVPHVTAAAFRAQVNVNVPGRLQQFGHGKVGIPFLETPASLDGKNQFQVLGLVPVVQESIVSDFLETGRQDVRQVTPDEFGVLKRDAPAWLARPFSPGGKGHPPFVDGQDSAVRYRDFVGVPSQIFHGVAEPVEGFLYVGTPVLLVKAVTEPGPSMRVAQPFTSGGKCQLAAFMKGVKAGKVLPLELVPEHPYRDEETAPRLPYLAVWREPPAGHDAVHVHVVEQLLVPCVEDLDDAGRRAETFLVGGQFQDRLGAALVEQPVEEGLVAVNQAVQFMRHREDHVEVGRVDHLGPALVNP